MRSTWKSKLQRFNGGAVAALLTANAFAVAMLVAGEPATRVGVEDPAGATGEAARETVTLVTTADGRQFVADPSTPEGRAAIENAERVGAQVERVTTTQTVTTTPTSTPGSTVPAKQGGGRTLGPDLDLSLLPKLPIDLDDTLDGIQDTIDDTVDGIQDTVNDTVDDVQTTVPTPLDDTVDDVQDTVDDTVDGVQDTVGDTVDSVKDTAGSVGGTLNDTVGALEGTVSGLAGGGGSSGGSSGGTGTLGGLGSVGGLLGA